MTFADPVESLNAVSTELREAEAQIPKAHKDLVIRAADKLDDQQRQIEDLTAGVRLVKGYLIEWANKLELSTQVRIGQMDSDSRAQEKAAEAQVAVLDVVRHMRELK